MSCRERIQAREGWCGKQLSAQAAKLLHALVTLLLSTSEKPRDLHALNSTHG